MAEIINFPTPDERSDRFYDAVVDELIKGGHDAAIVKGALQSAVGRIDQSKTLQLGVTFRSDMSEDEVIAAVRVIVDKAREPLMTQIIALEVTLAYERVGRPLPA